MQFATREEFRAWLCEYGRTVQSLWLVFGKKGGPKTLSPQEALEEALCFGWIDGLIKRLDDTSYLKYFAQRRKESVWSAKNRELVAALEQQGRMTEHGRAEVEEAKRRGTWDPPAPEPWTDEEANRLANDLKGTEPAYENYLAMPASVRTTYNAHYLDAKTEETRARRLAQIIERLNRNLKPM